MLAILAPAKKMDFDSKLIAPAYVKAPLFREKTQKLVDLLASLDIEEMKTLMKISDTIAEKTCGNINDFSFGENLERLKPACFAFKGETYKGLDAESFSDDDLIFSEESLRILSGLYGILSPLTLIEPYRFEMGLRFEIDGIKKITDYWKETVTDELNRLISKKKKKQIINLASTEYMTVVDKKKLEAEIIDIVFQEKRNGQLKTISTFSKKARGMMARYIVRERIEDCNSLKNFISAGYKFEAALSNDKNYVFVR